MSQELAEEFSLLRQQFLESLAPHAHKLGQIWSRLQWELWNPEQARDLQQFLHKLSATGANYGYSDISGSAGYLATYLQELCDLQRSPSHNECSHLEAKVEALKQLMQDATLANPPKLQFPTATAANQSAHAGQLLLVIDGDPGHASLVVHFLKHAGFNARGFTSINACIQAAIDTNPDAILLDAELHPEGALALIHTLRGVFTQNPPIILMSARTDVQTRLRALRAGCSDYLLKPLNFEQLLEKLLQSLRSPERAYRVLIVDDDLDMAEFEAEVLRYAGMEVLCVDNPLKSLEKASQFHPDLVILDLHMPEVNGLELAQLLRQDPDFELLPIIFITADTDLDVHEKIKALGVNALLLKPIEADQLIKRVEQALRSTQALKSRVARITQYSQQPHQANSAYFFAAVDEAIHATTEAQQQSAIYYLSPMDYQQLSDQLDRIELSNINEQFCAYLSKILGADEHWISLSPLVACVLSGRRHINYHYQRGEQLSRHLSQFRYRSGPREIPLEFNLGLVCLEPDLGNAHQALLAAESAFDLQCGQTPLSLSAQVEPPQEDIAELMHIPELNDQLDNEALTGSLLGLPGLDLSQLDMAQDLRLAFQPIISLEGEHIEHFEVLVRLRLDNGELINASQFIHQLENQGKREELDRWVLQAAVNTLAEAPNIREEATLFIHLARDTLNHNAFFSFAANVLHASRLRGSNRLVFMLEEPWVAANNQQALNVAKALLDIDCGVCLTQAGATASCEQILRQLPLHYMRLTPTLTRLGFDPQPLKELLAAAKSEQIQVIASHIESSRNLSSLWLLGVRLFEGFFIQAPDAGFHLQNDIVFSKEVVDQGRF